MSMCLGIPSRVQSSFKRLFLWMALPLLALGGCSSSNHSDLDTFMAEVKEKPSGVIEPIPLFKPYQVFRYNAAAQRAPFEIPVKVSEIASLTRKSNVRPDKNRRKEQLEFFSIEALSMVGTLGRDGTTWALVEDPNGSVHQVLVGNYVGRNHGRIASVGYDSLAIVEIISNGKDSWIERPRTLKLKDGN